MAAGIRVEGLRKCYGAREAVSGVSLAARPGEIVGLLGPNGAGKTTTMRILAALLPRDAGEVSVAGFDPAKSPLEVKRRVGYVPEDAPLYGVLTPYEYLDFVGRLRGLDGLHGRIDRVMRLFDLWGEALRRLAAFSRGMRQRVVLAAALLHDPEVLLLDEPLAGLDPAGAWTTQELIRRLAGQGKAILFSSHVLEVTARVCDRVIVLDRGRVVAEGTGDGIRREGALEELFRRLAAPDDPAARVDEFLRGR